VVKSANNSDHFVFFGKITECMEPYSEHNNYWHLYSTFRQVFLRFYVFNALKNFKWTFFAFMVLLLLLLPVLTITYTATAILLR